MQTKPKEPSKHADEQNVRDASIAALRLARISFLTSTAIALLSTYLSIAVGNHWWPWELNEALAAANRVTGYVEFSYPTKLGLHTGQITVTIVNDSTSPIRDVLLYMPVKATTSHAGISPASAVGLMDMQPCDQQVYGVVVSIGQNDQDPDTTRFHLMFMVDGHAYDSSLTSTRTKPLKDLHGDGAVETVDGKVGDIYGIGGLSHLRGWQSETNSERPSNGPGCG
jgi:hypothetical protein